jgi:uncharacterized protein (TIRG00374 family)
MKVRRFILSLVIAAVFVAAVGWISGVRFQDIIDRLAACRVEYLALAFAAYAGSYGFRAVRFRVLLGGASPSVVKLFSVVAVHNFMNQLLPARTGELSYIYLLRNRFGVTTSTGVATLVKARCLDLLCLMLFFALGLLIYGRRSDLSGHVLVVASVAILLTALAVLLHLPGIARAGLWLYSKVAALTRLKGKDWVEVVFAKGKEVEQAFQALESRGLLFSAFLLSLLIWLGIFLTCYLILLSMGVLDYSFGESIVGTTALNATCVLPINSLGNLGTWEAGWAAGYIFLGMNKELAVETGAGEHVVIYSFGLLLWLWGWIGLRGSRGDEKKADLGEENP